MKKYVLALLAFCAIAGAVVALCLTLNGSCERIQNGSVLPEGGLDGPAAIDGLVYDEAEGGYRIHIEGLPEGVPLCVTMYFRVAEIWQGDTCVAVLSESTESQRIATVPVEVPNGRLELLIRTAPGSIVPGIEGYSLGTLFTPYSAQRPKVVLSSVEDAGRLSAAGNGFYYALIGAYLMLMAACLVMFRRKPAERYLLTVCVAAFFVLLYLLTAVESGFIRFDYGMANQLSTLTNLLPVLCLAYTCVGLYAEALPPKLRKVFSLPVFLGAAVLCVTAEALTGIYLYQFMRRVVLVPVLVVLACAVQQRRRGSRLLFAAYAVMEGIALFLYVSNCILDAPYSPFLMFVRVKELSNLIFLSACAAVIFDRFSTKFSEADILAEEVQAMNAELERKVEERTGQLVQEQEKKHNMMLNIFHDLRNPVFVLKGRLASMHPDGAEEQEAIGVMAARVNYLEKLINDLFLVAKLESGDVQYDQDAVDLKELCETVLRDLSGEAEEKKIVLAGKICREPAETWGDAWRLQQALVNLVENALFYTPPNGEVTLSLCREADWCVLAVADTGKGITPEELQRVFERYYRAQSRDQHSTGLGLSIVKEIVEAHRGSVSVVSVKGEGTCFTMKLPFWQE